ncbi:SusC/RagA family TonB-linked outer membrane protein [Mucilaginibacter sp. Bleaf8]|uniref:SusC/RagA family TonB-linked outer membrane protein n=1 Tax=Mucilaginibacter sp. Bleaf8 TaxID=2834430 RepID=UPI001BCF78F6|nr:SusC/RagA family TonB-linked outer membrane protein [Mucilaginibacter sp. Bleaf8]MBS7563726.1 SusC/RagA family TonB-linked outer membrane protein [Mucilaginibacter sp. Bleaf8]
MIKFFYKRKILYCSSVIITFFVLNAVKLYGQSLPVAGTQVTVSGIVKDNSGPLPGATVSIVGSSSAVSTNTSGAFTIKAEFGKSISVRMIGYLSQTVQVTGAKSNVIVVLKTDQKNLKDVVVIGYQQVSRRTLSAAVTSVDPKSIADVPAPTFDALLQGRVAGLNVQNFSGEPGVRSNVVLRGNTAVSRNIDNNTGSASGKASLARAISGPLYVIDGVPQSTEDIAAINYGSGTSTDVLAGIPIGDIGSIDILKDASAAAVYGSRGANGVIIITTKKGVAGKTRINFSTYHGITNSPNLDKVLTGAEETRAKLDLLRHYGNYDNLKNIPQILTDTLNPAFNNANDYRGQLYQTGRVDNYELSATGGNDVLTYRYGLNYYDESGIIKKTGLKRYSINSTVGINISPRLKVSTQIRFYRVDRPTSLSDISGNVNPFTGGYYANSPLPPSNLYLTQDNRDFLFGSTNKSTDNNTNNSITISPTIDWKISDHFLFNSVLSYESAGSRRDTYTPGVVRQSGYGYASSFVDNSANYLLSSNIQYNTTINKVHHLNVLLGQNMEYHNYRATSATADGIPNDQISIVKVLDKNGSTAFSDLIESGIATEFVRLNYDYKGRYLISGVMNADASSKFGPGNRVGYFPSVSAGWIVSDEPFMQFAKSWLTLFKLRGSYGITGRQPDSGDNYLSFNSYNIGAGGFAGSSSPQTGANLSTTYNGVAAIAPNFNGGLSNKDLTWEHSKQLNVGFDLTILDGRFNAVVDAYVKNTSQGIFTLNLPVTTGYRTIVTNSIGTQNRGLEASFISHYFSPKSAFQWETDFNIAYNQNEITSLPNGGRDIYLDKYLLRQGQPINEYNLFQQTGIYKTDKDVPINPVTGAPINFYGYPFKGGDPIWKDSNGDGTLDATDYVPAGNPNPKFTGGFSNIFGYKNWTLSVFCTFTLGRDIYNDYLVGKLSHLVPNDDQDSDPYHAITNNAFPDLTGINYWRNPGDDATYPSLSSVSGTHYKYAAVSSAWVENGSYMRIKTVSLAYTFKPAVLSKLHLSRLRVYGMVDNLHIFQKSNVPDAEQVDAFGVYNGSGYPIPKKFTMGLDLSF